MLRYHGGMEQAIDGIKKQVDNLLHLAIENRKLLNSLVAAVNVCVSEVQVCITVQAKHGQALSELMNDFSNHVRGNSFKPSKPKLTPLPLPEEDSEEP